MAKRSTASSFIGRVGQRRQVVLPKALCDAVGIDEGDFVEVSATGGLVLIKPKRLVDAEDILSDKEAKKVRRGLTELKRGQSTDWQDVKKNARRS
jgi:AbrB family looped-hinge helix DNA binding protein